MSTRRSRATSFFRLCLLNLFESRDVFFLTRRYRQSSCRPYCVFLNQRRVPRELLVRLATACYETLSNHEYRTFAVLRSGERLWLNLLDNQGDRQWLHGFRFV